MEERNEKQGKDNKMKGNLDERNNG